MADAIDNLAQDLNQANPSVDAMYPLGYENYYIPRPDDFGVPQELNQTGDRWIWDARNPQWGYYKYAQNLSNPSTLGTGTEIDFNTPDDPTIRTNIGNTDEQDAFVRTGIGTTLDPKTEDRYGFTGLVPPDKAGTFIGVQYLDPSEAAVTTAGQIPSLPQGVVTRGEPVGRTFEDFTQRPDYSVPIGFDADTGDIVMSNRNNIRDTILVPSGRSISQADIDRGVSPNVTIPTNWNKGINAAPSTSQVTPTSVGAYQPVGADEPTTTSEGGFDNTGGNVSVGPGGVKDITPGWKEEAKPKPKVENDVDGDGISDVWRIATGGNWRFDTEGNWSNVNPDYIDPKTGREEPPNNTGDRWNFRTGEWDYKDVPGTTPPGTTTPPGGGTTTTPPGGGTKPPGGGGQPGGGTPGGGPPGGGTPGRGPTPLPPREPVTPLVRREVVIPTKGTKEVPLPDRQADPFAKLYADLLANSQQQQDQYRYINYDPDQIMNAAMSGFRRRGAMRSLQG